MLFRQLVFNANEVILTIALRHHNPPSETFHKLCQVTLCLLHNCQKYWYSFQKQFVGCARYNAPIMMYIVMNPLMLPCFMYNLVHVTICCSISCYQPNHAFWLAHILMFIHPSIILKSMMI
jgi:hypothetical protein